jgi:hypothetical protein
MKLQAEQLGRAADTEIPKKTGRPKSALQPGEDFVPPRFPRKPKEYARAKWLWVQAVTRDSKFTDFQVRVGIDIALRHNIEKGYAEISTSRIRKDVGSRAADNTGVIRAINVFVEEGYLDVHYNSGRKGVNRYYLRKVILLRSDEDGGQKLVPRGG